MAENPLHKLMNPSSIAFMGASNNITRMGTFLLMNTIAGKFKGDIYPIHPKEETILGRKVYKSITDLPKPVDLLVLCIPTGLVPDILEEAGRKGINRAIIVTAGYDEIESSEGKELQKRINNIVEKYGIRYVGPNCIGIYNGFASLNTTVCPNTMPPGKVGMISHSGTYMSHIFFYMETLRFNYGEGLSLGNGISIDTVDTLEYFEERDDIKVIAMYLEGIKRPAKFLETARRISRKKPILALYAGGTETGGRAAGTHTAAMSGDDKIYDAAFRQAGIIRVYSIEELIDAAWAFSTQPLPKGNRMAILSISGGPSTSMADAISRCGLTLPVFSPEISNAIKKHLPHTGASINPIDITFSMDQAVFYRHIPEIVLGSDEIDGLLIYGILGPDWLLHLNNLMDIDIHVPDEKVLASVGIAQGKEFVNFIRQFGKPVLGSTFQSNMDRMVCTAREEGIPLYTGPERAVKAMALMYQYNMYRSRLPEEN